MGEAELSSDTFLQASRSPIYRILIIEISWHKPDRKIGALYIIFCVLEDFPKKVIPLIKLLYKPTVHFKRKAPVTLQNDSDQQGHIQLELNRTFHTRD